MVYDIFNFLTGYVYIKICGMRTEQVLNSNITFWNVSRCPGGIYANVSYFAYKRLVKSGGVRVELIKVKGLPAFFWQMKNNKVLFFGLLICAALIFIGSNMVLGVEVSGYYSIPREEIEKAVEEQGIKRFMFKQRVDLDGLSKHLMSKDNIAWVSAGYDGVILHIELIEQVNENDDSPRDIVAKRRAVIKSIDVFSGVRNKQEGDVVEKGDLLVAGIRQNEDGVERIRARADIIGTSWESGSYEVETNNMNIENTGNVQKESYIDFWGIKSYIDKNDVAFEHYVVTADEKYLGGFRAVIPVKYVNKTYHEVKLFGDKKEIDKATKQAELLSFEKAAAKLPKNASIVGKSVEHKLDGGRIVVETVLEFESDIGIGKGFE